MLLFALLAAASAAPLAPLWTSGTNAALNASTASCPTTVAVPHCMQTCPEWCWATTVAVVQDFYSGKTASCEADECAVVSDATGLSCCSASECSGTCGQGGTVSEIQSELNKGEQAFSYSGSALSESALIQHLQAGHPVLRLTTGHIDIVTGICDGGMYQLTDSEYQSLLTISYSDLLQSPYNPAARWVGTFVPSSTVEKA
jgi:hypothetical protein